MANYTKSFNFRSGVQVDNDRFLVDGRGNVGVGTSAPNRSLDVYGKARVNDQLETEDFQVSGVSTFQGMVSVGASIFANSETGIISATSYRGDGTLLAGVIAIATNGWVVNSGTLSTDFNVYVGPFPPGEGNLDHLPTAEGTFQVNKDSSTFTVQPTGLIGLGTTLPTERLDVRGNVVVSGLSTFQDHVDVTGDLSVLSNFEVTGVSTFSNNVNYSTDIDVDGVTNLDELSVTGVSTFTSSVNLNDGATIPAGESLDFGTDFSISRFSNQNKARIQYTGPGDFTFEIDDVDFRNSGNTETLMTLRNGGGVSLYYDNNIKLSSTSAGINVTGRTETDNLNVSGISTFASTLDLDGVVNIPDGDGVKFGTVSDYAQLFSGSGEFYIRNTVGSGGGGGVQLQGRTSVNLWAGGTSFTNLGLSVENGVSLLKYQGNEKASTEDYGFDVTGRLTTDELSVSGISTFNQLTSTNIAIGTSVFSSDFVVKKPTSVVADFISTQGSVTLSLGADTSLADNSTTIKYTPTSETLDISNRGSGDITFRTHVGSGALVGVEAGGFLFRTGTTDNILAHIRSDGRFAINQEVSADQELDFNLVANGNSLLKGNLFVQGNLDASSGIATFNTINVNTPSIFSEDQNFHTTSGLTTFSSLNAETLFTSSGISSFIGFSTYYGSVCFGIKDNQNGETYGAGSDVEMKIYHPIRTYGTEIGISSSPIYYDNAGTYSGSSQFDYVQALSDPRNEDLLSQYVADPNKIIPAFGYGDIQLKTGGMSIISQDYINIHPSIAQSSTGSWTGLTPSENLGMGLEYVNGTNLCMVGINTLFTRSVMDLGYGVPSMNSYVIPPRLNTNDIETVSNLWDPTVSSGLSGHSRSKQSTPDGLVTGGILFDIEKNQLKVATDSKTFSGIATFTNNGSGHESFVPPTVTDAERTTLTNAGIPVGSVVYNTTNNALEQYDGTVWTSFVKKTTSDDISVSVSGTDLTITVDGVGSVTLTLS